MIRDLVGVEALLQSLVSIFREAESLFATEKYRRVRVDTLEVRRTVIKHELERLLSDMHDKVAALRTSIPYQPGLSKVLLNSHELIEELTALLLITTINEDQSALDGAAENATISSTLIPEALSTRTLDPIRTLDDQRQEQSSQQQVLSQITDAAPTGSCDLPESVLQVLKSLPLHDIWISQDQYGSLSNGIKAWVEDTTKVEWDWWPLQQRRRLLRPGESRMFWNCVGNHPLPIVLKTAICADTFTALRVNTLGGIN